MPLTRRGALLGLFVAPAIIRPGLLMPIRPLRRGPSIHYMGNPAPSGISWEEYISAREQSRIERLMHEFNAYGFVVYYEDNYV